MALAPDPQPQPVAAHAQRRRQVACPRSARPIEFPPCGIYTFDAEDRLAGQKIYDDRATVLDQLGVFHAPDRAAGLQVRARTIRMRKDRK